MSAPYQADVSSDVEKKVLRHAEIAKMTRTLQDRLALASYKTQRGMHKTRLSVLEANIETQLKRKRTSSSMETLSDSSSSASEHPFFSDAMHSSPITAPMFSDETFDAENSQLVRKKTRFQDAFVDPLLESATHKHIRAHSMAPPTFEPSHQSWKSMHNLPESSPIHSRLHPDFRTSHGPNISFVSDASTIPNSPPFGPGPDDDDDDDNLPIHSFHVAAASRMRGSPPRTPPPTRSRAARHRKGGNGVGEEGADLLMYLATSPSPANPGARNRVYQPSTPPSNHAALPSSMMSTPGGTNFFNTPGQQFNFSDFVNVTPSPAQGAFGSRTPAMSKTPLAAREARRRLNFDTIVAPNGSPVSNVGRGVASSSSGLGMELGGELVSS
ncbi:hypothetical protein MMC20_005017 [Loxospora ochrophaea]|nr:hypothetical protein [Loxospora ochrophaea]